MTHTLYILRHAKSSWDEPGLADHDRPLAPRGRRACELIAEHLRRERIAPELVLCSPAARARETLQRVAAAFGDRPDVRIEDGLYGASAGDLLERLREVDDGVGSVLLIGHNPAVQALAATLAESGAHEVERKLPTGALVTLALPGNWHVLAPGTARLVAFVKPRDLA